MKRELKTAHSNGKSSVEYGRPQEKKPLHRSHPPKRGEESRRSKSGVYDNGRRFKKKENWNHKAGGELKRE